MTMAALVEAKPVQVVALFDSWCVNAERVTVGKTYTVPLGDAQRLIACGKAKLS